MTAETPALVHNFKVGKRHVTITFPHVKTMEEIGTLVHVPADGTNGAKTSKLVKELCEFTRPIVVEWTPDMPRILHKKDWRQWRAGRDCAMERMAKLIGGNVLTIET